MWRSFYDAPQQALSFLVQQASIIEPGVYRIQYPDIQYPNLVPVQTQGPEWAKSVTFFSLDMVGKAQWFHHYGSDMPFADITREKFEHTIDLAAIGYRYTVEELNQAAMMGLGLTDEKAAAARRSYQEFMENVAFRGDTGKNWTGLINQSGVTAGNVAADGTGSSTLWANKTADQMIRDVNALLSGIYSTSLTIETADTVLLPVSQYQTLASTRLTGLERTAMSWLQEYNSYTIATGRPLTIRAVRGLETAGAGSTARIVAYRRDPQVLKLHLPMPHRFLEAWRTAVLVYDVPGIFRTGGIEVRRPTAVRYGDGI